MTNLPIDYIRYAADHALVVPAQINLRPYSVRIIQRSWSGIAGRIAPGVGVSTTTYTELYNGTIADGYCNPKYRQVSLKDIAQSGGVLRDVEAIIGPFVLPYDCSLGTGGIDPMSFSATQLNGTEFTIEIKGVQYPVQGAEFKKFSISTDRNVLFTINIQNMAT